jgi:MoaA/NifB/PqqE/SkfB family radical SAM enzyme
MSRKNKGLWSNPETDAPEMLPSNLPIFRELLADRRLHEFSLELRALLRSDPQYTPRKQRKVLEVAAKGERILRFEDRYVISSFVPPVPSRAFLSFVTGGLDRERLFTDLAYARRLAPLSAHLCVTSRCSYGCEHCGATYPDGGVELTKDEWIGVIRDLQELGIAYIVFSGGEPLMRDDLEEMIRAVDDRSVTLLFTNGRALTRERARSLKESGLFIAAVSLDSPNPAEHNRVRRHPQAFSHALAAIRNASQAGLYTLVSAVIFRRNLNKENLFRLFGLAKEHGAHEVRIHQPIPRGQLADTEDANQIFYTQQDIVALNRIQFAANRKKNGLPKVSSFPYTEGPHKFGCGAGVLHSYLSATGDLWPCDFVPLSFGNVLKEGVREVFTRMMRVAGVPKTYCWAKSLATRLKGKALPLTTEESVELCRNCRSRSYPRFFRELQAP